MFHFPWFAPLDPMNSGRGCRSYSPRRVSPFGYLRINARLATPRSFSQPPTSFIASWHLGIHHTPLVAYFPSSLAHAPCIRWFVEARDQGPGPCSSQQTRLSQSSLDRGFVSKAAEANSSQQKLISTLRMQLSKSARAKTNPRPNRRCPKTHGADRVRTDDFQLAKLALSQLSYSPEKGLHRRKVESRLSLEKPTDCETVE